MTVIFEPKIEATSESHMPDNWDLSLGIRLPDDFVVSRHRDGSVASRRKDLRWDLTMYQPRGNPLSLYFSYWVSGRGSSKRKMRAQEMTAEQVSRVDDIQHLMSLIIYKKRGGMVGPEMLRKFSAALCRMASHADNHGLAIPELLGDPQHLQDYCRVIPENHCAELAHLLGILISLDPELDVGFPVAGNAVIKDLQVRAKAHLDKYRQTPPIPSRIYSTIIKNLSIELDEFSAVADKYLQLTQDYFGDSRDRNRHGEYEVKVQDLIQDYGLGDYFESKNLSKTHTGISSGLTEIQIVCKLIIHAFSGMRNQEALSLPYHCLETELSHGRTHFLLCGQTTKLNRGKIRRTRWVTVEEGHRAVEVARCIANVIYKIIGDSPKKSISLINQYPLFVTTGYLGVAGKKQISSTGIYQANALGTINGDDHANLKSRLLPLIDEMDLNELEDIDPHRAWREEDEFQIGQRWTLRSHQFRRSLALYAQRSGLVSLPSLRRQLQHITKEMSLYYAKGSIFARNFIEDSTDDYAKHMCKEWRETKPISEALAYLRDVVFADEELFGGAGAFEQQKKNRGQVTDRETTMRQFKKGVIGYKEIPFGGCTKVGDCDKVGLRIVGVMCLQECKNIIVMMPKLESVILRQSNLVKSLDPSSITYRMEKDDLDAMCLAREKWLKKSEGRLNV